MEESPLAIDLIDRPHPPPPDADASGYKEWYHFSVLDTGGAADVVFNLSFEGDIRRPGRGDARLILLIHQAGSGWSGGIDLFDGTDLELADGTTGLELGGSSIRCRDGGFRIRASLGDPPLDLEAELIAENRPLLIWNDTPLGSGAINWLVFPHLTASGHLTAPGLTLQFSQARAYHDHNWGCWRWGEDFGWIWGFSISRKPGGRELPVAAVFNRTTDREGSVAKERTVALWEGPRLLKIFTRRSVRFQRLGTFRGGPVRRIPGVMSLLCQGDVTSVPERLRIEAVDGRDWIEAELKVESAIQIAVPSDLGFGVAAIIETFGTLTMSGRVAGRNLGFSARACFELMGGP